jgi:hypothetical protein
VCRVTRIAEAYYRYVNQGKNPSDFPVVVLPGVSHMEFASGTPPSNVKNNDLKPSISYDQAHQDIANTVENFVKGLLGDASSATALEKQVSDTGAFVQPIIQAYLLEGFAHFKPPCNTNGFADSPCTPECQCGSPWTERAQAMMAGLPSIQVTVTDVMHPVWQVLPHVHLPKIWNNCSAPTPACDLNISTITQLVYAKLDSLDTGFYPQAAEEMRCKLVSRQNAYVSAGISDADFNQTDSGNLCAYINDQSYGWALNNSGAATASRFQSVGQPLEMGKDISEFGGPAWIWSALAFADNNSTGAETVSSPAQATPLKYPIAAAAGFHYCKLLSPARAMEWIYIDGLRKNMHL